MARNYRRLVAFELADQLAIAVYEATADFPFHERYGLRGQLRRAAVSVPTNIVEGAARDSEAEYLRFLEIAYASAREVEYLTMLAQRLGFLRPPEAGDLTSRTGRTAAAIYALRRALRRS
ncbi:MAG: four helix bundle protein [Acidobacteria bacterium]|nr:four helix bundle protein [Acidobacteriota bacterium]